MLVEPPTCISHVCEDCPVVNVGNVKVTETAVVELSVTVICPLPPEF